MAKGLQKCMENNMFKTINAIAGGRTGDFLHQLYVPAMLYKMHEIKTNLFIAELGDIFYFGLESAYSELYDIIKNQKFINNFSIYDGSKLDYNLSEWRISNPNLGWTNKLYQKYIGFDKVIYKDFKIIEYENKLNELKDSLVINRSLDYRRHGPIEVQEFVINKFAERFFIFTDIKQYEEYPLKHLVKPLYAENIDGFFKVINSCKLFMGNLSAPMAIAYCLQKNLICEFGQIDTESYKAETEYYSNISWFNNNQIFLSQKIKEIGIDIS